MKTRNLRRAFFNLRILTASVLCLVAGMFALFAFGVAPLGIQSLTHRFAGGPASAQGYGAARGAIKLDKNPADRSQALLPAAVKYSGPPQILAPVAAVRSAKLRDLAPINPATVTKNPVPEPRRPKPPTKRGGPRGHAQTKAGEQISAPTPTGLNFDGVGVGLGGFSPSGNPPDVNGRVGSTQFVQWNNTSFAVFNKTTGALEYGPAAGNTLFQALGGVCASHNDGDPVVSYDILAGRWILSQFVVAAGQTDYSHQCLAISATSDATGEYYLYDFQTDPVNFVDYPHTGVWPDGYYMSAHVFGAGLVFTTGRIYVFEREKMIHGLPARMQSSDLGAEFGFLPADLDSLTPPAAGEAEFLLGPNFALTELTTSHRVAVTWDPAPTMVVTSGPPIMGGIGNAPCLSGATDDGRDCVPEPAPAVPTDYLDNLGGHYMYRLAYRNNGTQALPQESLVVSGPSDSSDVNHGAVEWFEFRNAGSSTTQPTLFQSGIFDPDTSYRWMPSAAMDKDGNIALGYSKSSPTIKPGIYLTGRLADDPVGTMGAETEMKAGLGSQLGAGNRWGDYTAMTLDPIDQCTFYYTNEYLQANGGFNWSTRIASFKFPSCASAAGLWGIVKGTITSSATSAPVPGVTVTLSNGYAGAADVNGLYTILVPAGTYTAVAADANRNCTAASPASAMVSPPGGGMVTQNFTVTGASKLEANGFTIDDALGNNNGIVNRGECVKLNLGVQNNGCAPETAIQATLTTSTAGVTIDQGSSTYPDMAIDQSGTNATPFKISVSDSFVCGTEIMLSLNLTYAGGMKTIQYIIPTCAGGPDQQIPPSQLMTSDATQADRIGRDGRPSPCGGKASPGGGFAGTHYYKTFNFTNTSGAARCYTVTINAALGGPGDIESVAYDQVYDPTMLDTNYLGDTGISGLGTTVDHASYSFTVPAGHTFVVVVNTTGGEPPSGPVSSPFSGTVSGFINNTAGPGDCATLPAAPAFTGAASRLTHGAAGPFDIPMPLDGSGVEPRNGSGNYTMVLHFDMPMQSGNAMVTSGVGSVSSVSFSGNDMLVNLAGVADQQTLTVTGTNLTGVNGGVLPSANITMGFLVGDTTMNGLVNASDIGQTKSQSGVILSQSNCPNDVTINGEINATDISLVKSRSGTALPPASP